MQKTLIDSSFLFSLYHPGEKNHADSVALSQLGEFEFLTPDVVLPEVTFLFNREVGFPATITFLEKFVAAGSKLEPITLPDLNRAKEIMAAYPKAELDLVDCVIMALSERLQITQICTYDRRDFVIFRPRHCAYLELLP